MGNKRYYLINNDKTVQYIRLDSELPFSIDEGVAEIKESMPNAEITHISKMKAEKFLGLDKTI